MNTTFLMIHPMCIHSTLAKVDKLLYSIPLKEDMLLTQIFSLSVCLPGWHNNACEEMAHCNNIIFGGVNALHKN